MAWSKTTVKKKYSDNEMVSSSEPDLFLVTVGPARNIWSITTTIEEKLVELVPIYDMQEQATELLNNLHDNSFQSSAIKLSKLPPLVADRNILFMLNPKYQVRFNELFF